MKRQPGALRRAFLACLPLLIAAAPSIRAGPLFQVPRAQLIAAIKTIGVMPVTVDDAVPNADEVAARLEEDITRRLEQGGFTVVPPSAMRAIRDLAQVSLGGLYDPMTGLPIQERIAALQEFADHEYQTLHPVDAILRADVVRHEATFVMGAAAWDGVDERVMSGASAVFAQMMSGPSTRCNVPALSLAVSLSDTRGKALYTAAGGLVTLDYPTPGGSLANYDLATVDPTLVMGDASLTTQALAVTLDPLVTGAISKTISFTLHAPQAAEKTPPPTLKDLLHQHRRLGLASLELPEPAAEQNDRVQTHYADMLVARLTALGFEVAGKNDSGGLWAAERARVGGFYDRYTGRLDLTKITAARAQVLATLSERYHASALVIPSIVLRAAPFSQGYARWDGVTQPVTGRGSVLFNKSIFNNNLAYSGELEAYSLKLQIIDDTGKVLFQGMGGVALTKHLEDGHPVPVPEPFGNAASGDAGVAVALRALR